jgi:hypothetical protein
MGQVDQDFNALADDLMALFAADAGDKAHSAGIVLVLGMIETLSRGNAGSWMRWMHGNPLILNKTKMCFAADDLRNRLRNAAGAIRSSGLRLNETFQNRFSQGAVHFDSDHRHFHLRSQIGETARCVFNGPGAQVQCLQGKKLTFLLYRKLPCRVEVLFASARFPVTAGREN